jgi:hypothetical protein
MYAYPLVRLRSGDAWLKNGAYLNDPDGNSEPDRDKCGPASIVAMGPGDYRCWFEGVTPVKTLDIPNQPGTFDYDTTICYATSSDGLTWTKRTSGNLTEAIVSVAITPTNPPGGSLSWMRGESSVGTVLWDKEESIFKLWGHGGNNTGPRAIYYATSSDGLSWTFQNSGQPVLERSSPTSNWDGLWVADARVVKLGVGRYIMLFRGTSASTPPQIGLATSTDGVSWTKNGSNPVIPVGAGGQWDDSVTYPAGLIYDQFREKLHCWYGGSPTADDGGQGLGYAVSNDYGVTWTKLATNPVLGISTSVTGQDAVSMGDTIGATIVGRRIFVHWGSERSDWSPAFRGRLMAVPDCPVPSFRNFARVNGRGAG